MRTTAGALSAYQVVELEALPGWSWGRRQQGWMDGLNSLRRYVVETGSATPGQRETLDGFRLGQWANERRSEYKRGALALDRIATLESLPGWCWDPTEQKWRHGWSVMVAYSAATGHAHPPQREKFDDYPIGAWVHAQRMMYRQGRLSEERRDRFESLPGWWWFPPM